MGKPLDYGIEKAEFRPGQEEAIIEAATCPEQVVLIDAPTGTGKSIIAKGILSIAGGMRSVGRVAKGGGMVATKTKQLQDQYLEDFPAMRKAIGRGNFGCPVGHKSAAEAPCADGGPCDLKFTNDCPYYAARRDAWSARELAVNYDLLAASWAGAGSRESPIQGRRVIVMDEAHLADSSLRSANAVTLRLNSLPPDRGFPRGVDKLAWMEWAYAVQDWLRDDHRIKWVLDNLDHETYRQFRREIRWWQAMERLLNLLVYEREVVVRRDAETVVFEPLWARTAFKRIMMDTDKIVLMSATMPGPELMARLLGVELGEYRVIHLPSIFPPERRPIRYKPVANLTHSKVNSDELDRLAIAVADQLMASQDEKGIIHTNSYKLQWEIVYRLSQAGFARRLMAHGSGGMDRALLEQFKEALPGTFLVSPVAQSGVDLPGEHVRTQMILKVPFPDTTDPVIAARKVAEPETYPQMTAASLEQMVGRAMRSPDDYGQTIIFDKAFGWFYRQNKHLFSPSFQEAVR